LGDLALSIPTPAEVARASSELCQLKDEILLTTTLRLIVPAFTEFLVHQYHILTIAGRIITRTIWHTNMRPSGYVSRGNYSRVHVGQEGYVQIVTPQVIVCECCSDGLNIWWTIYRNDHPLSRRLDEPIRGSKHWNEEYGEMQATIKVTHGMRMWECFEWTRLI
jgi:hypothetical protein